MTAKEVSKHPVNHILCSFADSSQALRAQQLLTDNGFEEVELFEGEDAADNMTTRAKWFADTDEDLRRFQNKLREGYAVLSAKVTDKESRQAAHDLVSQCDADVITHFGKWVTRTMNA